MQTIYLDISNKGVVPTIYAKQGDVGRKFLAIINDGGMPYAIPEDATISVWYQTLKNNNAGTVDGVSFADNKLEISIDPVITAVNGEGVLCLTVSFANGDEISTWNIPYDVEMKPGAEPVDPSIPSAQKTAVLYTKQTLTDEQQAQARENIGADASPLNGKTAVFDGDSICNGSSAGDGLSGWAGRIGTNNAMTWKNYARGGGTITQIEGHYCIGGNIDTIHSEYPTLDYLIFEGGTNDADLLGEDGLGTFSATDYSGNYNTATFTGAFETLLYKAVTYYPTAKIGYIVAHNMRTAIRRTYFDRAVELCKKWGVPYIDLWYGSHLNRLLTAHYDPSLDSQDNIDAGKLYTDGQHLTPTGYEVITPKIEAWMKNLYTWSNPCNNSNTGDPTQVNDEEIGSAPWSSKNTVDKLCPDFNETGSTVRCEPVEGYPLEVVASEEATKITRCGKNLYDVNVYPLTNGRYINKGSGGYTSGAAYAATEDYIPVSHLRGLTINLNHIPGGSNPGMAFYDESHTYISGDKGDEITVPSTASYMRFTVDSSYADGKDVQLEIGDKATAFEPYNGDVFSKGERVPALKGINMLYADSGEITVNGKADPVVVTENLSKVVTGKYELIEDTTLNEAVASFQRNTTPDGVKYNFSAIRIIVETTANTSSANVSHIMYRDNEYYYSFIYVNVSVVETSVKCSLFKCYNDHGLIDYHWSVGTPGVNVSTHRRLESMCEEWTNVKAIKLTCSANIPAGTRIRIYAIRG